MNYACISKQTAFPHCPQDGNVTSFCWWTAGPKMQTRILHSRTRWNRCRFMECPAILILPPSIFLTMKHTGDTAVHSSHGLHLPILALCIHDATGWGGDAKNQNFTADQGSAAELHPKLLRIAKLAIIENNSKTFQRPRSTQRNTGEFARRRT